MDVKVNFFFLLMIEMLTLTAQRDYLHNFLQYIKRHRMQDMSVGECSKLAPLPLLKDTTRPHLCKVERGRFVATSLSLSCRSSCSLLFTIRWQNSFLCLPSVSCWHETVFRLWPSFSMSEVFRKSEDVSESPAEPCSFDRFLHCFLGPWCRLSEVEDVAVH